MSESAFFLRRMNDPIQYLGRIKATLAERGQWLDSEGPEQASALGGASRAIFDSLLRPHEAFHQASHQALSCKTTGDMAEMESAMTEMFKLSVTLVDTLIKLDTLSQGK